MTRDTYAPGVRCGRSVLGGRTPPLAPPVSMSSYPEVTEAYSCSSTANHDGSDSLLP